MKAKPLFIASPETQENVQNSVLDVSTSDVRLFLKDLLSFGNTKLPKTTAIFNMGPAMHCPSRKLGLCELGNKCYALKAEKFRPQVLPYRTRQSNYWYLCSAEQFADEFTEIYNRKRIKPTLLRFNESGDFWTQDCYYKANKIAKILKERHGIVSYCYTHRTDLVYHNFNQSLQVLKSGFNHNDYLAAKYVAVKNIEPIRQEIETFDHNRRAKLPQDMKYICKGSCKTCSLCSVLKSGTIYTQIH